MDINNCVEVRINVDCRQVGKINLTIIMPDGQQVPEADIPSENQQAVVPAGQQVPKADISSESQQAIVPAGKWIFISKSAPEGGQRNIIAKMPFSGKRCINRIWANECSVGKMDLWFEETLNSDEPSGEKDCVILATLPKKSLPVNGIDLIVTVTRPGGLIKTIALWTLTADDAITERYHNTFKNDAGDGCYSVRIQPSGNNNSRNGEVMHVYGSLADATQFQRQTDAEPPKRSSFIRRIFKP